MKRNAPKGIEGDGSKRSLIKNLFTIHPPSTIHSLPKLANLTLVQFDRKLVKTNNAEYYEIERVMMFVGKACRNQNRQY